MPESRNMGGTDTILLGERPSFESQLPLAKLGFKKYWLICSGMDAEDIYQHCCIGLLTAYRKYDWSKPTSWSAYAMAAIYMELSFANSFRHGKKRIPEEDIVSYDCEGSPIVLADPNIFEDIIDARTVLYSRIKKMKRIVRRYLYMYYILDMSYSEIGKVHGVSRQNVQQVISRAISQLKIYLTKDKVATRLKTVGGD